MICNCHTTGEHAVWCPSFATAPIVTHEERQHQAAYSGGRKLDLRPEAIHRGNIPIIPPPGDFYPSSVSYKYLNDGKASHLPAGAQERKALPLATGCIDYFPDALAAVAALSRIGNDQHNPGKPMFWDRSKSGDESDALMRHFLDRGTWDLDGVRHSTKVAWRALALLQKELEADRSGSVEGVNPGTDVSDKPV